MAHQRQVIREAVKAALVGKTAAGPRVYETRTTPWLRVQLPAISVYTLEETVDPESRKTAPRELTRTIKLAVQAVVEQGINMDDALDAISLEIERAMHADPSFGDTCSDSVLAATEQLYEDGGNRPIGAAILTYSVIYFTDAPAAADLAPLDDFATAGITTDLSGTTDPDDQAQDVVAVPVT